MSIYLSSKTTCPGRDHQLELDYDERGGLTNIRLFHLKKNVEANLTFDDLGFLGCCRCSVQEILDLVRQPSR